MPSVLFVDAPICRGFFYAQQLCYEAFGWRTGRKPSFGLH
jgi:hypothetical protein